MIWEAEEVKQCLERQVVDFLQLSIIRMIIISCISKIGLFLVHFAFSLIDFICFSSFRVLSQR